MTSQKPTQSAEVWFINAVEDFVADIYVNGEPEPSLANVKALEVGPVFTVEGTAQRPYQTHRFAARRRNDRAGEPLAEVSVKLTRGLSYTAVLHVTDVPGSYRLSVFANDFAPSGNARLEVRHVGYPGEVDWTLTPADDTDSRIPQDTRTGHLTRAQWQQATEVVPNAYYLEARVGDVVHAYWPDIDLATERMAVAYVLGDPQPGQMAPQELRRYWLVQEFKLPVGAPAEVTVTDPAWPHTDRNRDKPIKFETRPIEVYEASQGASRIRVTDPDGWISGVVVESVEPAAGDVRIPDNAVAPSPELGAPATATVYIGGDLPVGPYLVRVRTNPDAVTESAVHTIPLTVKPVTIGRLYATLDRLQDDRAIAPGFAEQLRQLLYDAGVAVNRDDPAAARRHLKAVDAAAEARKDDAVTEPAAKQVRRAVQALLGRLASKQPA
jgi:hypothetical protein